jgi:hypothetical protein
LWPNSPRSILAEAEDRFLQIADDFVWLNPHASLSVDWFGNIRRTKSTDPTWAKWKPSDPTSPHWYTAAHLERLIAGYISHDADLARDRTVREVIAEFRGLSATAKQKVVLEATGLSRAPLSQLVNGDRIDRHAVEELLVAMKAQSKPVKPAMLGIIGRDHFKARFAAAGCAMESFDHRRVMEVEDDIPFVIETAFGWCPDATARRLITGVNWSPGIVNPFRQLGRFGMSLDTVLTRQRASESEPVILVLHIACPWVEYLDRGKSAVVTS